MTGEMDLTVLLRTLSAEMAEGVYVFATLAPSAAAGLPLGTAPRMVFHEAEGTTLILLRSEAERLGLDATFPCRMITLTVHSSLKAVGFIAHIARAFTEAGLGVNPVSGYFHDHLFVPLGRETEALEILARLAAEARSAAPRA